LPDVDLVIIRENTEDLYAGIEYEQGAPETDELIGWIESHGGSLRHRDAGISIKPLSITGARAGSSSSPSTTRAA
jgi:isocitrate dehydrogenase (NAD+)